MEPNHSPGLKKPEEQSIAAPSSRRKFFQVAGVAGVLATVAACHKGGDGFPGGGKHGHGKTINLGSGDVGILNYAYALEQLEAAFYTRVSLYPYRRISAAEKARLDDIRDHEIAHRE